MAMVNAYIVHKTHMQKQGKAVMAREEFLAVLQAQMVAITDDDMDASDGVSRVYIVFMYTNLCFC